MNDPSPSSPRSFPSPEIESLLARGLNSFRLPVSLLCKANYLATQGTAKAKQETLLERKHSYLGIVPILERIAMKKRTAAVLPFPLFQTIFGNVPKFVYTCARTLLSDSPKILFVYFSYFLT